MAANIGAILMIVLALIPLLAILALWVGSLYDKRLANALYKLHLYRLGGAHMLFSSDKRFPKKTLDSQNIDVKKEKQIIFVRHGESAWNLVFNKGFGKDFPKRLSDAVLKETELFPTLDSVFIDSPLSKIGTNQAVDLQNFIESGDNELNDVLFGQAGAPKSVIVSSNLRRALSTGTIAFWNRLRRTQEKIHILSSLQEVTFNVDGVSLAKAFSAPQLADTELAALDFTSAEDFESSRYFDASDNKGNKPVRSNGFDRLLQFCEWCFDEKRNDTPTIIACGHSLYFRYFFQSFLPKISGHRAKKLKMENCSVVAFTLQQGQKKGHTWYKIDESSIKPLYLGFEEKKKAKLE